VRLRSSAMSRIYGLGSQWVLRLTARRLRRPDGPELPARSGMPAVWRRSIVEALEVIDLLDERLAPLEAELKLIARADPDVALLRTIPGVGDLLAPTISAEIGDISRCSSPRKLVGHAGMAPRASTSPASAASPGYRSPRQARERSAGRRSRRPNTPATGPAPARPLPRPRQAQRRQRRQVRGRPQDPDRRLAHALPPTTVIHRPGGTAGGWRTHRRTASKLPANQEFTRGLESRYPSFGGSRVRISYDDVRESVRTTAAAVSLTAAPSRKGVPATDPGDILVPANGGVS